MDTKLRKFNNNMAVKTVAFILCVIFFIATLTSAGYVTNVLSNLDNYGGVEDVCRSKNYLESSSFQSEYGEKLDTILNLLETYKNEEYIKAGNTVNSYDVEEAIKDFFYNGEYYSSSSEDGASYNIYSGDTDYYSKYGGDYNDPGVAERFKTEYATEIEKIKQTMINDDLRDYTILKKELDQTKGFTYYATDGTTTLTNLSAFDQTQNITESGEKAADTNIPKTTWTDKEAYLIYENGVLTKYPAEKGITLREAKSYHSQLQKHLDSKLNEKLVVAFAFDKEYLSGKQADFEAAKVEFMAWIPIVLACGLMTFITFVYLAVITGRRNEEGQLEEYPFDSLYTEIQLMLIAIAGGFGGYTFLQLLYTAFSSKYVFDGRGIQVNQGIQFLPLGGAILVGIAAAAIGLWFILACIRMLKARTFLNHSLLFKIMKSLFHSIMQIYHGSSTMRKIVLIALAVCLLSVTIFFAPVAIVLVLIFAPKWVNKYDEIKKGIKEVKNGNLTYKISIEGDSELDRLAKDINAISEASNKAIQNELKNQRLKTDLISNVSHDLKTPLTSIITYIDLLKTEGLTCNDAPNYLEILDQKSQRLLKLTEDLFDAAKASSGAIPVRFEKVEMLSLISQGLGELSDKIDKSNLEFRVNAEKDKYFVHGDGQLLWRVVENLLGNVLKYAQEGSRVYIDIKELKNSASKKPMIIMEMKNISKNELNVNADELMERFKRGDESRTTEGSGLGLAIAKDLVRLQNGWFEIKIDGDLFKAIAMLESYPEEEEQ